MTDYLLFAILGLGSGAVVSFIALGIVLGYRGAGVINFAQGGMAMYCAYVFLALRTEGRYLLPVPGLPGFVDRFAVVGPPEACAERLTGLAAQGVDRFVLTGSSFGADRDEARTAATLITTELLPALRE